MSTTASVQEVAATTTVEHSPNTSKPDLEDSDNTMTHALTTITESAAPSNGLSDSAMKTTTLSHISPAIAGMTDLFEAPTTSLVMDNNIQAMEPASTTVMTPVTIAPAMTTLLTMTIPDEHIVDPLFKEPDQTVSVITTTDVPATALPLPAVTTSMLMGMLGESANEIFKLQDESISVAVPSMTDNKIEPTTSQLSPAPSEAPIMPSLDAIPTKSNEYSIIQSPDEVDNVLTMSSNEDTTRMVSSTDSKVDSGDKHVVALASETESPKSQETKKEMEPNGKSGCNSISTSFVVLSMAVLYVIV